MQCELYGRDPVLKLAWISYVFRCAKICSIVMPKEPYSWRWAPNCVIHLVIQGAVCRFRAENTGKTKELWCSNSSHFTSLNTVLSTKIFTVFCLVVFICFLGEGVVGLLVLFLIEMHWCIDLRATMLQVVPRLTYSFLWQGEIGRPGRKVWTKVLSQKFI